MADNSMTAARTKLKKLQKEDEAKAAAAASKSSAERSPHTKEVCHPSEKSMLVRDLILAAMLEEA